jgi:uncharacterized glyoxalase superfamily metalloenzyme YdcJ
MDLYTGAMKFCLGEMDAATHRARAARALANLAGAADRDYLKLHFKHLRHEEIDAWAHRALPGDFVEKLAESLTARLRQEDLQLSRLNHAGFKDFTEGPPEGVPILLRQDAYKALTEPVVFQQPDGSSVKTEHTARFGEIEQRFYATTPAGRQLYDECLAAAEAARARNPNLIKQDYAAYLKEYAECFSAFPKTLRELLDRKLVYGKFAPTAAGLAARDSGNLPANLDELVRLGYAQADGLRYEDFLPVSAAGIFASNLGQYGTKSTAAEKPKYSREKLEEILGKKILDADEIYKAQEAESIRETLSRLGVAPAKSAPERNAAVAA